MTVPTPCGLKDVASELSISSVNLALNDSRIRTLAGIASGPIGLKDCEGKSATMSVSIGNDQSAEDASPPHGFSLTATPTGGTGPYTYAWAILTTSGTLSASFTSTTAQSTTLSNSPASPGVASIVTVHCVVTDAHSVAATSNTVSLTYTSP